MAIKYVSIFEYMKKYELPMPLWFFHPELEQDSPQWDSLGYRLTVRKLKRFLEARRPHERNLYYRLFPLPVGWDDWMPKDEAEVSVEETCVCKRMLRIRKWEPNCPKWDSFRQEDALCIYAGDREDEYSPAAWESFLIRLQKDDPHNTQVHSIEHLLLMSYALYRGNMGLLEKLDLCFPEESLWRDTLQQCMSCRTPGWKEVLPHLLGLGLYRKFTQNHTLREMLQSTGDTPIVYIDPDNPLLGGEFKNGKFHGQNLYGIALMQVRSELNRIYDNLVLCLGTGESEDTQTDDLPFPFE